MTDRIPTAKLREYLECAKKATPLYCNPSRGTTEYSSEAHYVFHSQHCGKEVAIFTDRETSRDDAAFHVYVREWCIALIEECLRARGETV